MPALRELQIGFAAALTNREAVARFTPGVRVEGIEAERRLQVYRNNLCATLSEALAAVYPVTRRLVGAAYFEHAARGYIANHPSRSGDLHHFGGLFPDYLGGYPNSDELPYLPDTARLEWGYHRAFHAEQHPPLDTEGLRAVPPEVHSRLRLTLQPSARLLTSAYPVLRIWQVNQDDWPGDPTVDLAEGGIRLLILRQGVEVAFIPLGAGEHLLLQGLTHGLTLLDAQQQAVACEPEFDLATVLQRHISIGTCSGWRT